MVPKHRVDPAPVTQWTRGTLTSQKIPDRAQRTKFNDIGADTLTNASSAFSTSSDPKLNNCGDDGDRTHDLRLAKPALYQLSYIPKEAKSNGTVATKGVDDVPGPFGDQRAIMRAPHRPSGGVSLTQRPDHPPSKNLRTPWPALVYKRHIFPPTPRAVDQTTAKCARSAF